MPNKTERIQKTIAHSGVLSRREAEKAILEGRVTLNGKTVTELGTQVNPCSDKIEVDHQLIKKIEKKVYLALNKPRQVITSKKDPQNRVTVMDIIPKEFSHLNPAGRLDYDSEGLLILTNDGELLHRVTHPSFQVKKKYIVKTKGIPQASDLKTLTTGVKLEDGLGKFNSVRIKEIRKDKAILDITVTEGRNRFIRRMLDGIGYPVNRLRRVQVGSTTLGSLPTGEFQLLNTKEIENLKKSTIQ